MNIVTRSDWGARPPRSRRTIALPSSGLWLHHTAGNEPDGAAGVRAIQRFHQGPQRGWADIAYNYIVDRQGNVFEGRGAGVQGAHTQGYNTDHAICVVGHYDNERPTSATLDAIADLVRHGHERGWWPDHITGGHRDVGSTSCPGTHLYSQIPHINRLAALDEEPPEPATTWLEDIMAAGEAQLTDIADTLADHTRHRKQHAALDRARAELEAARWVAEVRTQFGLDPDPASDVWWAPRLADGRKTVSDVVEALAGKAGT